MKKKAFNILAFLMIILVAGSCSDGVDGINGMDGVDAAPIQIFEIGTDLLFNPAANWYATPFQTFANDESIENDDVVLVYRLEFITSDDLDVWRQLPRPYFTDQGMLVYNFDFSIWEESDFLLRDQIFRIVAFPSEILELTSNIDLSDFGSLMKSLRLNQSDVRRIQ
ncbi:hypothetical protein FK220_007395 [Flavobacteriaceae bacterium TP-CH-4]|uniref:Dihydrolipoamide dehydrogenase n=1 Tax=Pelagihabitans pacificus TaxID=2696054 RepID=A0A967ARR2_9FLAO|nr:hypothetical protein [Pelagihabitans pacificus]NHF59159.1 hypothetical protein [Pelagihabitans pacificus]